MQLKKKALFYSIATVLPMALCMTVIANAVQPAAPTRATDPIYTLTIRAADISAGRATSSGGASFGFTVSNVTASDNKICFAKGGSLTLNDPINGTTGVSFAPSAGFSSDDKLTLKSGYSAGNYGASAYLTKAVASQDAYYRTHFSFVSDLDAIEVDSLTLTYQCREHYRFTPVMETITENVTPGVEATYSGLSYVNDAGPDLEEVDIVKERFTLTVPLQDAEPIYSIHPIAKFYDKGGCLIKQIQGFWVAHVNPIIRFYTSKDSFVPYSYEYGEDFKDSILQSGKLSGFDWREYTLTAAQKKASGGTFINPDDGVLTQPLEQSLDLYPSVTIKVNPGSYSSDAPSSRVFIPNPGLANYGFPEVPAPSNVSEHYVFRRYVNGDEQYDPATASDFHDYDLYAEYASDFDLRLKFINRGFDNAYLEIGIANGNSISMPGDESYIDQSTLGLKLGDACFYDGSIYSHSTGYLVYPEGHREQGEFYGSGATFTNNGLGTMENPATYIAEPYTKWLPSDSSFKYYEFDLIVQRQAGLPDEGLWITTLKNYHEHMYYDGIDEPRTFFKKTVIPDGIPTGMQDAFPTYSSYACVWSSAGAGVLYEHATEDLGIAFTDELELIIGNEYYYLTQMYAFRDNHALKRLEHFPHLNTISRGAFTNCPNLLPMQEWKGVDNVCEIDGWAFADCFVNPVIDSNHNISRRDFILPNGLTDLGSYVFEHAIYTDFTIDGDGLSSLSANAFAYSDSSEHSADFQKALDAYNAASSETKHLYIGSLKAVANHVTFQGSEAEYETLTGQNYDELAVLLADEYYVTFTE